MFTNLMIHKNFPQIWGVDMFLHGKNNTQLLFFEFKFYSYLITLNFTMPLYRPIFTIFCALFIKITTSKNFFTPLMCLGCSDHFSCER